MRIVLEISSYKAIVISFFRKHNSKDIYSFPMIIKAVEKIGFQIKQCSLCTLSGGPIIQFYGLKNWYGKILRISLRNIII